MDVTWDGRPVAPENPRGSSIVVWRRAAASPEFLILHRAAAGPLEFEGDWAWTPPAGARQPGEDSEDAALRELREETGLDLACERTELGTEEWLVFLAQAPAVADVVLDEEHDRYLWLPAPEAAAKCLPRNVGESILAAERFVADR